MLFKHFPIQTHMEPKLTFALKGQRQAVKRISMQNIYSGHENIGKRRLKHRKIFPVALMVQRCIK